MRTCLQKFLPFVVTGCLMGIIGVFESPNVVPADHPGRRADPATSILIFSAAAFVATLASSVVVLIFPLRRGGDCLSHGTGCIVYFCVAASVAYGYAVWLDHQQSVQSAWSVTEATIVSFNRHTSESMPARSSSRRVDSQYFYSYWVGGMKYRGDFVERVHLRTSSDERRLRHRHEVIQVFYDPHDPGVSTAQRARGGGNQAIWAAILMTAAVAAAIYKMICVRLRSACIGIQEA